MDSLDLFMNMLTFAAGVYCLYSWWRLRQEKHLFPNQLLVPKDAKPSDCIDEEGYIQYISTKVLIIGLVVTLVSLLTMVDVMTGFVEAHFLSIHPNIEFYVHEGGVAICLVILVWFMICWNKARKEYW